MKKILISTLPLMITCLMAAAQFNIDSVLSSVGKNNMTLIAHKQYREAKNLEYKTGLAPANPTIGFDYMIGNPSNAGNQTDIIVNQTFDFPTTYAKKKQLSREQIAQSEYQVEAIRKDVLLEAQLICIELIYRNKLQSELISRKNKTEKWLNDFQIRLGKGEGNVLDVNKAKLQLIEINASFQENLSWINQLNQKLTELNGGKQIDISGLSYELPDHIPNFETLEKDIEVKDPIRKFLEQEKVIGQKEIELAKSLALPKLETGYHYQAILGQRFNGVHLGLSIPLWESKNTVKTKNAELTLHESNLQNHINEHYYHIKQNYERVENLKITLNEYSRLFSSINSVELLDKALSLGHISTIEYYVEVNFYYEALKNYLKTEMEYYKAIAELYKYHL